MEIGSPTYTASYKTKVNHITTEEYGAKAWRPKNSRIDKQKLDENGLKKLPIWQDAVRRYAFLSK